MKKSCYINAILLTFFIFSGCRNEIKPDPVSNNIRTYLIQKATDITDNSLSEIKRLSDWDKIKNKRYAEFIEMMSLTDVPLKGDRSPLNVKITGTIQKDSYRIEKLYYESLPGLYVAANLYIPDNLTKPAPAILYVCGHSPTQKVSYQTHPKKFAQLGFVCLIIETIQFGEVYGNHWGPYSKGWFNWYSRGYNPAGVELWNAIRGIDLLTSREEVDSENLGVTGISGGGSQSWYIAAADPRVKAVAPVCGASTLKAQIGSRTIDGHCDCMMPINTYSQDFTDIGALIAPRPMLICQADRDGLNTIESVHELFTRTREIYKLYNAVDNIDLVETPGGHSYHKISRERIFSFFIKQLMGKDVLPEEAGDVDESQSELLSFDDLKAFTDGPLKDDRSPAIENAFVRRSPAPQILNAADLDAFRDSVKIFLATKTFGAFPEKEQAFNKILEYRADDGGKFGEVIFSFISEEGWRLKVNIHWAQRQDSANPLIIMLRNYNEDRWDTESFADQIANGQNIAFFEVRGIGESGWAPGLQWHARRAAAWTGRTVASMQVYDLLRCIEFCRTLPGVDANKISIAARDEMSVVALYAALMDGKCQSIVLKNPPGTQDVAGDTYGRGPATEMLNCLRITDVNQLPALLTPTRVLFYGEIPPAYQWSADILEKSGKDSFEIIH